MAYTSTQPLFSTRAAYVPVPVSCLLGQLVRLTLILSERFWFSAVFILRTSGNIIHVAKDQQHKRVNKIPICTILGNVLLPNEPLISPHVLLMNGWTIGYLYLAAITRIVFVYLCVFLCLYSTFM